jgi:hypothetical protein
MQNMFSMHWNEYAKYMKYAYAYVQYALKHKICAHLPSSVAMAWTSTASFRENHL